MAWEISEQPSRHIKAQSDEKRTTREAAMTLGLAERRPDEMCAREESGVVDAIARDIFGEQTNVTADDNDGRKRRLTFTQYPSQVHSAWGPSRIPCFWSVPTTTHKLSLTASLTAGARNGRTWS